MCIRDSSDTLGQNMLYVAIPVYKNNEFMGIVRTATTLTPIENNYETIKQVILSALLCTSLLSILLGIWLTNKNTKPIPVSYTHLHNQQSKCDYQCNNPI